MRLDGNQIFISGPVGMFDASVDAVIEQAKGRNDLELVMVGADGGSAETAFKFYDEFKGRVRRSEIFGRCVSASVVIAMTSPEIWIHPDARFVIHPPNEALVGGIDEMRLAIERLGMLTERLVKLVSDRTGQPREMVAGWYASLPDTIFNATEAIAIGLADKLLPLSKTEKRASLDLTVEPARDDSGLFFDVLAGFQTLHVPEREHFMRNLFYWAQSNVRQSE